MIDYADSKYIAVWTHHPIFGDASFDNFERLPGNPVCSGVEGYEWPVNGTLFKDPISGNWYLYIGWYPRNYGYYEDRPYKCTIFRSKDKGKTWVELGPAIAGLGSHIFEGLSSPLTFAPDAAVCYKDGKYYMSFDWHAKADNWYDHIKYSGAACAVADSPEGPFQPICVYALTGDLVPALGKYNRVYASTLIPRETDWLALTISDSQDYYGWSLMGQTAPKPEGPWTKPKLLLHPQMDCYYPQLIEFFPQFMHDGYIYAPGTSAATNRNYQIIYRVPINDAMNPDAWSLYQGGSIWHAEPFESEYEGIWGQALPGFVDDDGTFNVMFPSRNSKNEGTINLARRPWNKPLREKGFVVSGHGAPSLIVLRCDTLLSSLSAKLEVYGAVQIVWNHHGPFGPDRPMSNCGLHPLMRAQYDALELTEKFWALVSYDKAGDRFEIASGQLSDSHERTIELTFSGQNMSITLDGKKCWRGELKTGKGRVGLWAEQYSIAKVKSFVVDGDISETAMPLLYTEGLVCAAQNLADWNEVESDQFRYGVGAVSKSDDIEVKWNFIGDGFVIHAPTGPDYGKGEVVVNGESLGVIDFNSPTSASSHLLFEKRGLPKVSYGVKLRVIEGSIPIDVFEAFSR